MGNDSTSTLERIDRAIARIEASIAARISADVALTLRHEALRDRVTQVIATLDALIDQGSGS